MVLEGAYMRKPMLVLQRLWGGVHPTCGVFCPLGGKVGFTSEHFLSHTTLLVVCLCPTGVVGRLHAYALGLVKDFLWNTTITVER